MGFRMYRMDDVAAWLASSECSTISGLLLPEPQPVKAIDDPLIGRLGAHPTAPLSATADKGRMIDTAVIAIITRDLIGV